MVDIKVENHGSIILFTPLTTKAKRWVNENLPLESWQWLGKSFAVEPRYADDLVSGMQNDGLKVK